MAIGIALLFNIKLPINFNSPYKAQDIQDFWRRWHITLSRFLRDYIYIPLGGSRGGELNTYSNLMITFLLGGLWHGAGWTFIFWGFLHGLALVIHRIWKSFGFKLNILFAWFITFNFINISWIFFRAKEWDDAIRVFTSMFDITQFSIAFNSMAFVYILLALVMTLLFKNSKEFTLAIKDNSFIIYITLFLFIISCLQINNMMVSENKSEFLYFNF